MFCRGLIDGRWMDGERIDQKLEEEVGNREGQEVSDVRTSAVCLLHISAIFSPTDAILQGFDFPGCVTGGVASPATTRRLSAVFSKICAKMEWKPEPESRVWQQTSANLLLMNISDCGTLKMDLYSDWKSTTCFF